MNNSTGIKFIIRLLFAALYMSLLRWAEFFSPAFSISNRFLNPNAVFWSFGCTLWLL